MEKISHHATIGRKLRLGLAATVIMLAVFTSCTSDLGTDSFDAILASAPLHEAVYYERSSAVRKLLNEGTDPNAKIDAPEWGWWDGTANPLGIDGMTPLHLAVERGGNYLNSRRITIIKMLLDAGADPNAKTYEGDTPMDIAKRYGSGAIQGLLRSYGAVSF